MRSAVLALIVVATAPLAAMSQPPKPKDGPLGMKFVPLPKATFYMSVFPSGRVKTEIKDGFEIAIHTVTQGQWQAIMGNNPSYFSRAPISPIGTIERGKGKDKIKDIKDEDLQHFPVECVSWDNAQEFIKKLNEKEAGRGYLYRLPTDAEWEYACRGGATTEEECSYYFYFDKPTNDLSSRQANFNGEKPFGKADKGPWLQRTTKVGSYPPNKLGIHDMHGNISQWTATLYDPKRPLRVIRGGDWFVPASSCTANARSASRPSAVESQLGFRLVRVASGGKWGGTQERGERSKSKESGFRLASGR